MIELGLSEFKTATPLLSGIKQKVLPLAITQGFSPGRIFVDAGENPQLALAWSAVGYYLLAGDPSQNHDLDAAGRVLNELFVPASQASGENGFILVPTAGGWQEHLPSLLPGREVIEIYRRPFRFEPARFALLSNWRERIPPGFRLQAMDAALAEQAGALVAWRSAEDFTTHGLGMALFEGDELASACSSVFASRERMEIDVHTEEKYRRRGLGTITTAAFIEACLRGGKQPNWECFWENEASNGLARKLGFVAEADYPVYFWEA
jgi:RimJ/RimL family protein N-acetyltransferase